MKSGLLLIACLFNISVQAQTPLPEPELGKLFLTPERRQALERQRQYNLRDTEATESETLQLNGIVQRSSGYNSIWLNQRMQPQTLTPRRPGVNSASSPVELEQGRQVRLQVGESINRNTEERKNVLPPKAIQPGNRN